MIHRFLKIEDGGWRMALHCLAILHPPSSILTETTGGLPSTYTNMAVGTILILNGTSSAGKTSILHELQATLDQPYLNAGIDKFIWMLPRRYLERPLWEEVLGHATQAGPLGQT